MLKLIVVNTEVMVIGTIQQLSKLDDSITVHIGSPDISPLEYKYKHLMEPVYQKELLPSIPDHGQSLWFKT